MPENGFWTVAEKIELYQMCLVEGRRWAKFAKYFKSTAQAVRNVFRRTDWEVFLEENNIDAEELVNQIDEVQMDGDPVKIAKQVDMLIKDRQNKLIEQAETRKSNERIKSLAEENIVLDKIMGAVSRIPFVSAEKLERKTYSSSPQEAVMLVGDPHLGLAVRPEEVGGMGGYGLEAFKRRWGRYVDGVIRVTDLHRKTHRIDKLHIAFLGDMVHGSNDAGQWGFLHTEQNVVDQLFEASSEFPKGILKLAQVFPEIEISCIYGNHGRVGKYGTEKKFVNWDYVLYRFMQASLEDYSNIKFTIPRSPFQVMNVMDKKFLLVHGSGIRSYVGIPWYGITRTEAKYRSLFDGSKSVEQMWAEMQKLGIDKKSPEDMMKFAFNYTRSFDYFVLGHFHQSGEMETGSGGRIIMNSSFIGGDDYSINDLVAASVPSQKFFGINHHGKTWTYDIELER